jgi:hypothetical protein
MHNVFHVFLNKLCILMVYESMTDFHKRENNLDLYSRRIASTSSP